MNDTNMDRSWNWFHLVVDEEKRITNQSYHDVWPNLILEEIQ